MLVATSARTVSGAQHAQRPAPPPSQLAFALLALMAANNSAALAALKTARDSVYTELAAHNNIDVTARAADWAEVEEALKNKLEALLLSSASLSKPTATATAEPRNSTMRADAPKLDPNNPPGDFHVFASHVQAIAKQNGADINDSDGLPIKGSLTDSHESFLYGLLLQGMRESKLEYNGRPTAAAAAVRALLRQPLVQRLPSHSQLQLRALWP
jgi:hypothetical protein